MIGPRMAKPTNQPIGRRVLAGIVVVLILGLMIPLWFHTVESEKVRIDSERAKLNRDIAAVLRGQGDNIFLYDPADTDLLLHDLCQLRGLRSLTLDRTNVTDTGMTYIKDIPDLRVLTIDGARRIDDRGIDALAGHPNIEKLSLLNPEVTDAGVAALKKLPKLKMLSLQYVKGQPSYLTDAALDNIAEIHTLTTLTIAGTWYKQQAVQLLKVKRPDIRIIGDNEEDKGEGK
jgi:hypothetical protein